VALRPARHAVLTGAPGAGKTTLLDAAAAAGLATSHEVARRILQQPGGMQLRERDPLEFADAMLAAHLSELASVAELDGTVLFDRGLADVVGFLDVSGLPVSRAIDHACRTIRYHGPVFRAPAWQDIYRQDAERIQTLEEAIASDKAVTAAWRRYGYEVIDLPLTSVAERLAFVRAAIRL
jgi:predicted ATPase